MPPGSALNLDQWSEGELSTNVELMCLLPNGIYIPLQCSREATLTNIKRELWTKAKSEPLFNLLLDLNFYIFQCINYSAEQEDLLDEKRRLCDIKPFWSTLRVVRKAGDVEDRVLNSQIGLCIGKSLHEYDLMKNQEVHDFRSNMKRMCMSVQKAHMKWSWDRKAMYLFPPQVDLSAPDNLPENILINMRFSSSLSTTSVLQVRSTERPEDLVEKAQKKMSMYQQNTLAEEYVLKIRSCEDFLLGGHPLSKYKYIRKMIGKGQKPELILIHKSELKVEDRFKDPMFNVLAQKEEQAPPLPSKMGRHFSWDIEEKVRVTFHQAKNVNVVEKSGVRLKAGVFHGDEELCTFFTSKEVEGPDPRWGETYEADINVSNLPRMAKLCVMVYTLGNKRIVKTTSGAQLDGKQKKRNPRKDLVPIAWVNLTFFDYRSQLRTGPVKLFMWPASEDIDLNPLGPCESNPSRDDSTSIELSFEQYRQGSVSYPTFDKILERAADIARSDDNPFETPSEQILDELRQIVEKDPLEPLSEQEREDLWLARQDCRDQLPHALPRLLKCVHWNHRDEVAQMQALLQIWPQLKPEEAMELLDYRYPDVSVRQFAVKCLQQLSDEQLSQYLLQLVQALKYETHLDCALGKFLLDRALSNQRIGHFLFWHLRAEMHQSAVCTRFGLMLEAYCRGSMAHIKTLSKQVESLNKMKNLNELIKSKQAKQQDKGEIRDMMKKVLQQDSYADTLSNFISPLSPANKLRCLRLNKCKFMSSKMRPLWLVFENDDPIGDDVFLLFKNGDDLRQDMLTLQVMQIMDNIWQEEGLDLRIIPYRTLATGPKVGLIEVVTNAETIANIQKQHGSVNVLTAAFQKAALFEWLKKHSPTETKLNKAIEDFTLSCAGYCVATYVLGIGDRHNDNIMVKESGQTKMSWRQEDMDAALRRIRYGELSIRAAAKAYEVPETTLRRKYHGKSPQVARMGPPPILTAAEEKRIVDWAIHMARIGFGQSKDDIQNVVKNMIEKDGRENPFVDNRPGKKWWKSFSKRHPNLVYRRPQPIGKERAVVSSDRLNKWFRDFESYLTEQGALSILEEPTRIFNADESGFAIGGRLSDRVLAERGEKYVHEFKNTDKSQITVMVTAGATGCLLPPLIILPGNHRIGDVKTYEGAPKGAYFARTANGWMDGKAFFSYVANLFHPFVIQKKLPLPVLLLVDGLSAHQTIEVAEYCWQNQIILYRLPPNSTHVLQPCDVSIFKSLKNSWNNAEKDYRADHPGDYVTRTTFANVFRKAWEELKRKPEVVRNGFKATGLYPFSKSYNTSMVRPATLYQFRSPQEEQATQSPTSAWLGMHPASPQEPTSPMSITSDTLFDMEPASSLHPSVGQPSTSLHSSGQPSTSLHSSGGQPSTSLHSSGQPSTSLHSSGQPSTSLHSSGEQPSTSLHSSGGQPSTSLHSSAGQPSTSLHSSGGQPSTSLQPSNREPSTCKSPSTTPFLSSQRSNERPAAVRRLVWPSTQPLPSRVDRAQYSQRPLNEDFVSPALEYYTRYPVVEVSTNRRRKPDLPEAISGEEFLKYAKAKQNQKRQDEERKQKRREEREQKREKREQEKEVKRMRREEREQKRERREQEKEMKRRRREELEQKREKREREKEMKRRRRERRETLKKNKQRKEEEEVRKKREVRKSKKDTMVQQENLRKRRLEVDQTNMTKRRKKQEKTENRTLQLNERRRERKQRCCACTDCDAN